MYDLLDLVKRSYNSFNRVAAHGLVAFVLLYGGIVFADEVDVVDVSIEALGDQRFRVNVALLHADSGWDHYANQWVVLDEAGNTIGTRELLHPHVNEQPFTRSLTLEIPVSVKVITLVGFDSVHADGGATMTLDVPHPQ